MVQRRNGKVAYLTVDDIVPALRARSRPFVSAPSRGKLKCQDRSRLVSSTMPPSAPQWSTRPSIGPPRPNPDLTLRFTTAPATPIIIGAGTTLSVQHGTTSIGIKIQPVTTSFPDSPLHCYFPRHEGAP